MADKIVVLQAGRIEQVGSPMELYRTPANKFVAGFIGSPKMNFIEGEAASSRGAASIGVRPEHLSISTESGEWQGKVGVAEHLGSDTFLHIHTERIGNLTVRAPGEHDISHGDQVWISPDPSRIYRFDAAGQALA